jgi:hypothetical protein
VEEGRGGEVSAGRVNGEEQVARQGNEEDGVKHVEEGTSA